MTGDVKSALSGADEWVLHSTESEDRQVFWRLSDRHAERATMIETRALTVYVDREGKRGAAVCYLSGGEQDGGRVQDALTAAELVLNPGYQLPTGPVSYPVVDLAEELPDSDALAAYGDALHTRIRQAGTTLSHLELYAAREQDAVQASNGRHAEWAGTRYEMDLVVAGGPADAFEHRVLRRSRRLSDLAPDTVVEVASEVARDRARAELPPSGRMAVILPADELTRLLQTVRARVSAEALYQHYFPYQIGDVLVSSEGDPFTLHANALRPYALHSAPTDVSTVPGQRVLLVQNGVITGLLADPQYGAYLGMPPTGPAGTLEWEAGSAPALDLTQDGPVLEVVSFSANMPNPLTGDFAAEIKFGYLHENGHRTPVAQGSVSGNVLELLARCVRSKETEEHPGYFGPSRVRFEHVQVSGR
jgi:predicted Zn-dependent protease